MHPTVIEAYLEAHDRQPLADALGQRIENGVESDANGLSRDEAAVLRMLRRRLEGRR